MLIYDNFRYTGQTQVWRVPKGVTRAFFECWGAAGGMPSTLAYEVEAKTAGGKGPVNDSFTNNPFRDTQLGRSYSNNSGYASGIKRVKEGEVYHVNVGGNGGPGTSMIRLHRNGTRTVTSRGGSGGWNGGGVGGVGVRTYQNLYNSSSTKTTYTSASMPNAANVGQKWRDTSGTDTVYICKKRYTGGTGTLNNNWKRVTVSHRDSIGPSGGGGGGATDIRKNDNAIANRILVAGGSGGAGGRYSVTGPDAWAVVRCPADPAPPFGSDDESTGPRGVNKTWAGRVNYLTGGWGRGGMGGAPGPGTVNKPTLDGGTATIAGSGGPASYQHAEGAQPGIAKGSDGKGGDHEKGGAKGVGGTDGTIGSLGQGGRGADAAGGTNDFCAGGGGGGGGWYGGGGGGNGFKVTGITGGATHGGGGGGGSCYAGPEMSGFFFAGGVRPPEAEGSSGTGANGRGGFSRITYRLPPKVRWNSAPLAANALAAFDVTFTFQPAQVNGAKIAYYTVGSAVDPAATFPTTTTTIAVSNRNQTRFTHAFAAPANGVTNAYFVKVVDADGDSSDWLKVRTRGVTVVAHPGITPTTPGANTVNLTWPSGALNYGAYRITYTGLDMATNLEREYASGWRPGGSRVNLFPQPGFTNVTGWTVTSGAIATSVVAPVGVSGSAGRITWVAQDDELAVIATDVDMPFDNLIFEMPYRLHLDIASTVAFDPKPFLIQIEDAEGVLVAYEVSLAAVAANAFLPVDMTFTPRSQGITIKLFPSDALGVYGNTVAAQITQLGNALIEPAYEPTVIGEERFEDGIANWTAINSTLADSVLSSVSGTHSLQFTVTASAAIAGATSVTDFPVVANQSYTATAKVSSDTVARNLRVSLQFRTSGGATTGALVNGTLVLATLDDYVTVSCTGTAPSDAATVEVSIRSDAAVVAGEVYRADDIVVATNVFLPYFDGTNLNGNTGSVSWSGTSGNSVAVLAGSDVVAGSFTYDGPVLKDGVVSHELHTTDTLRFGNSPLVDTENFTIVPSTPATPTVALEVNHALGLMRLSINAADGADPDKTVAFDIFRNGTRIVRGLVPDPITRLAAYDDVPATNEAATYVVRAFDVNGGFADQADGTVTVVG